MPLKKQVVDISFAGGLETKVAPELVPPGSFLTLENARLNKVGAIEKRTGFALTARTAVQGGENVFAGKWVGKHQGVRLLGGVQRQNDDTTRLASDGPRMYHYSEALSKWRECGRHTPLDYTIQDATRTEQYLVPQVARIGNYVAYCATRYDVPASPVMDFVVLDKDSGMVVYEFSRNTGPIYNPRLVALDGQYIAIVAATSGGILNIFVWDSASPQSAPSPAAITGLGTVVDKNAWCVCEEKPQNSSDTHGSSFWLAYSTSTAMWVAKVSRAGAASPHVTVPGSSDAFKYSVCVASVNEGTNDRVVVAYQDDAGGDVLYSIFDTSLSAISGFGSAPQAITTTPATDSVIRMTSQLGKSDEPQGRLISKSFRIEWFVSFKDFIYHVIGGVLMGFGGVLGLGCTVGQAITGVSTLALGSFLVFISIVFGSALTMKIQYYKMVYEEEATFFKALIAALADMKLLPNSLRSLEAV